MELWIRSQDKTILTPISEKLQILTNIDIPQEQYIVIYNGEELGNYGSKERALEVLDEIQNIMLCNKERKYSGKGFINELGKVYIYEMPKD